MRLMICSGLIELLPLPSRFSLFRLLLPYLDRFLPRLCKGRELSRAAALADLAQVLQQGVRIPRGPLRIQAIF